MGSLVISLCSTFLSICSGIKSLLLERNSLLMEFRFYLSLSFLWAYHYSSFLVQRFIKRIKYEILLMVLFLVFFLFLASEALLFLSFFWASLHSLSSPTLGVWPAEGFYVPDPCELTFANTLLLSNAAVSLGGAFISLEISSSFLIFFSLFSFIQAG